MASSGVSSGDKGVNILAIGASGVGKSTIGNYIVLGWDSPWAKLKSRIGTKSGVFPEKVFPLLEQIPPGHRLLKKDDRDPKPPYHRFETSVGGTSCTQYPSTLKALWKSGKGFSQKTKVVSFTDLPGLPDTDPENNQSFYDFIVTNIRKEPVSAVIFVFSLERSTLDPKHLDQTAALFSEIGNHCRAPFHLVVNCKLGVPKDEFTGEIDEEKKREQIRLTKVAATRLTNYFAGQINFQDSNVHACYCLKDLKIKMAALASDLATRGMMYKSPLLKTFIEVEAEFKAMTTAKDLENKARQNIENQMNDLKCQIADLNGHITRLKASIISAGAAGAIGSFFSFGASAAAAAAAVAGMSATVLVLENNKAARETSLKNLQRRFDSGTAAFKAQVARVAKEKENFLALCEILAVKKYTKKK